MKRIITIILLFALGVYLFTLIDKTIWKTLFVIAWLNLMFIINELFVPKDMPDNYESHEDYKQNMKYNETKKKN